MQTIFAPTLAALDASGPVPGWHVPHPIGAMLMDMVDPGIGSRVVLIGPSALELGCDLMRRGHLNVTMIRAGEHLHDDKADIAIIPEVRSADMLGTAISSARQTLCPLGTIALGVARDAPADLTACAKLQLRLHGFGAVQLRDTPEGTLLRAELPLFGRLPCA